MKFFMPFEKLPTATGQMRKVTVRNGKPVFYEPAPVKKARADLMAALASHVPAKPMEHGVILKVEWRFPVSATHSRFDDHVQKPDVDNLMKIFNDCMTALGFWNDDRQIISMTVEKYYCSIPGIEVSVFENEVC